jgi:hypothetical protein
VTTRDLAGLLSGDPSAPYHLGQVIGFDFSHRPPMLLVDDVDRPMRFVGKPWDYTYKDVVVWIPSNGSPLVIGRLPGMTDDLEDWHLVGGVGEPVFQNSWVNFAGGFAEVGYYMQPDGWVQLKGLAKDGSSTAVIFTLPEGYRPPYRVQCTSVSNNQVCTIEIQDDGDVLKPSGGTNAHVSLSGISFPTQWNRGQWPVPKLETDWDVGSSTDPDLEMFIREDGWSYVKGVLAGTNGTRMFVVPEQARTRSKDHILVGDDNGSIGYARLNLSHKGVINHHAGTALTVHAGGMNWFSGSTIAEWTAPTLLNSWTNLGGALEVAGHYTDHHNVCHLQGVVTGSNNSPIFTLPVGSRPLERQIFFALAANESLCRVDVLADGSVQRGFTPATASGYLSLTGIHFRAEQ